MIKIAILGSTGTIGLTALNVVRQNKKNFNIILLSTNSNINKVFNQAKEFNVKNIIISGKKINHSWKKKFKKNNINIFYNFKNLKKILKKKIDYTLNSISGIDGLEPTINIIKFTRKIAIANKEAIICGWNLINKKLIKNKTKFIPVDSEHFSIFKLLNSEDSQLINKIIITASGGPFLNEKNNFKKIKVKDALKHPNWKMGKKITIDSSTLMNKVFEVIEAKKIFNINLDKIYILINPNSYLHAIIIFKNGTIKMLAHETNMDIPIFNSIYDFPSKNFYKTKDLNIDKINKLSLSKPNIRKFKTLNLLKLIPSKDSLFETVVITVNDELVNMFLSGKIDFRKLLFYLIKIINFKLFKKYCNIRPKSIKQIYKVRNVTKEFVNDYIKTK